jgi:cell division protein FtsB
VIASFLERTLPALILVVAVVGAPMMILSAEGLPRLRALEKELAQVHRENGEQRRQIEFLRKSVQNLKDNPDSVERIARDELGLVRKNEVVFQFSTAKGGPLPEGRGTVGPPCRSILPASSWRSGSCSERRSSMRSSST